MTFDVNALLTKIEATVVPELPEELNSATLRLHVSSRLARVGAIGNDQLKLRVLKGYIKEASRYISELLEFSHYFASISGKKFVKFAPEHQDALEALSTHVRRSTEIAELYTDALLKMHELVAARIKIQK
jgi:hypothetical protein